MTARSTVGRCPLVVVAQALLTLAGVLYAGVVLEAVVGWPLDPARSYLSELAALDQPTSGLFRSTDLVAGVLVVTGLVLLVLAHRSEHHGQGGALR